MSPKWQTHKPNDVVDFQAIKDFQVNLTEPQVIDGHKILSPQMPKIPKSSTFRTIKSPKFKGSKSLKFEIIKPPNISNSKLNDS